MGTPGHCEAGNGEWLAFLEFAEEELTSAEKNTEVCRRPRGAC